MKDALGDRKDDFRELSSLGTAPAKQGHGYASALVRMVSSMVRIPPLVWLSIQMFSRRMSINVRSGWHPAMLPPTKGSTICSVTSPSSVSIWAMIQAGRRVQYPLTLCVSVQILKRLDADITHRWSENRRRQPLMRRYSRCEQ